MFLFLFWQEISSFWGAVEIFLGAQMIQPPRKIVPYAYVKLRGVRDQQWKWALLYVITTGYKMGQNLAAQSISAEVKVSPTIAAVHSQTV